LGFNLFFISFVFCLINYLDSYIQQWGAEHGKNQSPEDGARSFTFRELAAATRNFREVNLIGEGGFGRVYKGRLETGEVSCCKQL
jgi:hypothetical protein